MPQSILRLNSPSWQAADKANPVKKQSLRNQAVAPLNKAALVSMRGLSPNDWQASGKKSLAVAVEMDGLI